jgi:surface protein
MQILGRTGSSGTKTDQTITFGALADLTAGDPDVDPGATASSGLTVTYASDDSGVATIVAGKIHAVAAGTCNITASQAGNITYNPAPDVVQSLNVVRKTITINDTVSGTLTVESPLDPAYLPDSYYSEDYTLTGVAVGQAITVEETSLDFPGVWVEVLDATDLTHPLVDDDLPITFTPLAGITYVIRASTLDEFVVGDYTLTTVSIPFLFSINTALGAGWSFTLPLVSWGTYNFVVNWGDGSSSTITAWNQAAKTHVYSGHGTYDITISGTITCWEAGSLPSARKVTNIKSWGPLKRCYFAGCYNMVVTATDILDLTDRYDLHNLFWGCSSITTVPSVISWDTSAITHFGGMFNGCTSFNQDLSGLDTSVAGQIWSMFEGATSFNQDLSAWDVTNVTTAGAMFDGVTLSTANYDALLIGWAAQSVQDGVDFSGGNSKYTAGGAAEAARTHLVTVHGWWITDGGMA